MEFRLSLIVSLFLVAIFASASLRATDEPVKIEIGDLLSAAQERLKAGTLIQPEGDSAYEIYTQVLAIAPENAQARAGLKRIAAQFEQLAQQRQVVPGHAGLQALRAQVQAQIEAQARRQREVARLLEQAERQLKASQWTQPENYNAYASYRKVLELAPENAQAKAGLERIAAHFEQLPAELSRAMGDNPILAVVQSNNAFALDLYAKLTMVEQGGNLFFSPASVYTALAMVYSGAGSVTAAEMRDTLHFNLEDRELHTEMRRLVSQLDSAGEGSQLSLANALWGQQGYTFLQGFLRLIRDQYGAGLETVDFQGATDLARTTINRWVEDRTHQRIKNLIQPGMLDLRTRLVLTNAIYFKGIWRVQFDPKDTRKEPFHLHSGGNVSVDMMHLQNKRFRVLREPTFRALEIPYAGEKFAMVLFVPELGTSLDAFEATLRQENLARWLSAMSRLELDEVAIPRFKLTRRYDLSTHLTKLGMTTAFRSEEADFSGMTGQRDLFLSKVLHKAFIEINEEGTEAAAATGAVMKLLMLREPLVFRADRPFMFLIQDRDTGAILFMGRIVTPTSIMTSQ
jgi:serpin B